MVGRERGGCKWWEIKPSEQSSGQTAGSRQEDSVDMIDSWVCDLFQVTASPISRDIKDPVFAHRRSATFYSRYLGEGTLVSQFSWNLDGSYCRGR